VKDDDVRTAVPMELDRLILDLENLRFASAGIKAGTTKFVK